MNNTIPHIIHYCWFGSAKKPKDVQGFIDSWKAQLPDYTFMEWNESNCDLNQEIDYVKEAYESKKYAFVSDYIRVKKLVEYGGVYLDTDVRIIRRFDKLLKKHDLVIGFQGAGNLGTAFMASIPGHPLFQEFMDSYAERHFIKDNGTLDLTSINVSIDPFFINRGLKIDEDRYQKISENIGVYPTDCFCAFNIKYWYPEPTKRTYTIHYMASTWHSKKTRLKIAIFRIMRKVLGKDNYYKLRRMVGKGNN